MNKLSTLMALVGLIMMALGGVVLLLGWAYIQYGFDPDHSVGYLIVGVIIAFVGAILWLIGAFRGEN
jgi:hypothetical protein